MNNFKKLKKSINKLNSTIKVTEEKECIVLEGEVDNWDMVVKCGNLAVDKKHYRGVVNNIKLKNFQQPKMRVSSIKDDKYHNKKVDVLIIGGGIVGTAILRELTKFNLKCLLVEKEDDVGTAQSSRNDGMIHAGIDLKNTSLKWKYNMRGNKLYDQLAKDLQEPLVRCGQYVLLTEKWHKLLKPFIKSRARKNQVPIRFYNKEEIKN